MARRTLSRYALFNAYSGSLLDGQWIRFMLTIAGLEEVIRGIPGLVIEHIFTSTDVRQDRTGESWLNAYLLKTHEQPAKR